MHTPLENAGAIDAFCDIFDDLYVERLPAKNEAEAALWSDDPKICLTKGFLVTPIKPDHEVDLLEAIAEWSTLEAPILATLEFTRKSFVAWFDEILTATSDPNPEELYAWRISNRTFRSAAELSRRQVRNISWCRIFGALLPRCKTQERAQLSMIGASMCAVFYLEQFAKTWDEYSAGFTQKSSQDRFSRVRAYWEIAIEQISHEGQ